jgi:hypothetical protein
MQRPRIIRIPAFRSGLFAALRVAGMTVIKRPAASINIAEGKNKDFFRVDLESGSLFFIVCLIGYLRLEGESRLKIERIASQ